MEKDLNFYNWNITKSFNHNELKHIELPSNILQKYRYLNINNPSFYDLHLFIADPTNNAFIQPFQIIPQNSLLSFEIPTEMTHNGLFILPIYNRNNSVDYETRAFIQFSQNNSGWNEKGIEINNVVTPNPYVTDDSYGMKYNPKTGIVTVTDTPTPIILDIIQSFNSNGFLFSFYIDDNDLSKFPHFNAGDTLQFLYGTPSDYQDLVDTGYRFDVTDNMNFGACEQSFFTIGLENQITGTIKLKNFKVYLA